MYLNVKMCYQHVIYCLTLLPLTKTIKKDEPGRTFHKGFIRICYYLCINIYSLFLIAGDI